MITVFRMTELRLRQIVVTQIGSVADNYEVFAADFSLSPLSVRVFNDMIFVEYKNAYIVIHNNGVRIFPIKNNERYPSAVYSLTVKQVKEPIMDIKTIDEYIHEEEPSYIKFIEDSFDSSLIKGKSPEEMTVINASKRISNPVISDIYDCIYSKLIDTKSSKTLMTLIRLMVSIRERYFTGISNRSSSRIDTRRRSSDRTVLVPVNLEEVMNNSRKEIDYILAKTHKPVPVKEDIKNGNIKDNVYDMSVNDTDTTFDKEKVEKILLDLLKD